MRVRVPPAERPRAFTLFFFSSTHSGSHYLKADKVCRYDGRCCNCQLQRPSKTALVTCFMRLLPVLVLALLISPSVGAGEEKKMEWPFSPVVAVKPPEGKKPGWVSNEIDRFILSKLEEKGLSPAEEASSRTLVRRLYFDLLGLPPEPGAVEAFLADQDPKAYSKLVDRLLADKRYGERWGRFWLDLARYADTAGYAGWGHPEHHLQIEGFEASNDPTLMGMWIGMHSKNLRVITCGFVSTVHNPLRTAEAISTMDNMLHGRFGVGLVRGYQARWVENFKIKDQVGPVGPWNKNQEMDVVNREYFAEYVDVVVTALTKDTFKYRGKYWEIPAIGLKNPHEHTVYTRFGQGVTEDMAIEEIGIAPRPFQTPHPPLYGGFSAFTNVMGRLPRRGRRPWTRSHPGRRSGVGWIDDLRGIGQRGKGTGRRHEMDVVKLGGAVWPTLSGTPLRLSRYAVSAYRGGH